MQVYALPTNAKEAGVDRFYEDLQDLQHQKQMSFSLEGTRMGEFNLDDHDICYCGQESLRRDGVALTVN